MNTRNTTEEMRELAQRARAAAQAMSRISAAQKSRALSGLADVLRERGEEILAANREDLARAEAQGMDAPRLDRLRLTPAIMEQMQRACRHMADLPDPIGVLDRQWQRPNGLLVGRMRVPLGVIAIIYESRPNVTIDAALLCIKAGNAVILRGGKEALGSNLALARALRTALERAGLPGDAAQLVENTGHDSVLALCALDDCIDVMIPRGGEKLIRAVVDAARMPVLRHFKGVCHAFVDAGADFAQALNIVYNGKVQRPGVCNALECLLVHSDAARAFLPMVAEKLGGAGVEFRACPVSLPLLGARAVAQRPDDLGCEFEALILAVRVVPGLDAALRHIARYGSKHTEVICTNNHEHAMRFLREADASMVAVNASSRFNDGGELGLGAEIGISTTKLHAYGPMGVRELTTSKFVLLGQGQVRA